MWDLPGLGLKPMSPALAGGFLTTEPPGKSPEFKFDYECELKMFLFFSQKYLFPSLVHSKG